MARNSFAAAIYDRAVSVETLWRSFEEAYGKSMGESMRIEVKSAADSLIEALSLESAGEAIADLLEVRDSRGALVRLSRALADVSKELTVLRGSEAGARILDHFDAEFCGLYTRKYEFKAALDTIVAALPFLNAMISGSGKGSAPHAADIFQPFRALGALATAKPSNPNHEFIRRCAKTLHVNGWEVTRNSGYDGKSATAFTRFTWEVSRAVLDILPLLKSPSEMADRPERDQKAIQYSVPADLDKWAATVAKALDGLTFYNPNPAR